MSFNDFNKEPYLVSRSDNPIYKCECVLSTDVLPIVGFDAVTKQFDRVFTNHSRPWYLHYHFYGDTPKDLVRRVPSILNCFNRSRRLRRARISGLRLCNLDTTKKPYRYTTDMVISSSYGAMLFATLANNYCRIDSEVYITFNPLVKQSYKGRRDMCRAKEFRHLDLVEKFFRRSKLSRHSCTIDRLEDEDLLDLGVIVWVVRSSRSIFDIVFAIIEALYDDISTVEFGPLRLLQLSKTPTADVDNYWQRPVDKFLYDARFKKASAFGIYHNNPEYPLY